MENFKKAVIEEGKKAGLEVTITSVKMMNGGCYEAFSVGDKIQLCVPVDEVRAMTDDPAKVVAVLKRNPVPSYPAFTKEQVLSTVKECVTGDKEWVSDKLGYPFLDLWVYYRFEVSEDASSAVTFAMAEALQITEEELRNSALKNREPQVTVLMDDGLEIVSLTNGGDFGAGIVVNSDYLKRCEKRFGKFVVVPASVHSVILVPWCENRGWLRQVVKEANVTVIEQRDKLSDSIYVLEDGRLRLG